MLAWRRQRRALRALARAPAQHRTRYPLLPVYWFPIINMDD